VNAAEHSHGGKWPGGRPASGASGEPGRRVLTDAALIGLIVLSAGLCLLGAPGAVRVPIVFLAAALGPSVALLRFLPEDNIASSMAVAVSLSLAIETAGSLLMLWSRSWHPVGFAALVGGLAAALLIVDLARHARAARSLA
jgi:ABC-type enterobactin transport system permease subunit